MFECRQKNAALNASSRKVRRSSTRATMLMEFDFLHIAKSAVARLIGRPRAASTKPNAPENIVGGAWKAPTESGTENNLELTNGLTKKVRLALRHAVDIRAARDADSALSRFSGMGLSVPVAESRASYFLPSITLMAMGERSVRNSPLATSAIGLVSPKIPFVMISGCCVTTATAVVSVMAAYVLTPESSRRMSAPLSMEWSSFRPTREAVS